MATITHGSFAESTQGNYKVKTTGSVSAATLGVTRSDSYVSPTETVNLSGKAITGSVIVSGGGDKGTAAVAATNTLTFDNTAYTAATATFTFGDTEFDDQNDATLILEDVEDTSATFTVKNDFSASAATEYNAGASAEICAANFIAAVNAHAIKITATNPSGAVIVLTQDLTGTDGNTTIGGANHDTICDVNPPAAFTLGAITAPSDAAITIIAADGASKTFTAVASGANAYLNQFNLGYSGADAATNLETLVDSTTKGLGGKVSVARSTGQLTFTQDVAGAAGNTVVTVAGNLEAYMSISPSTNFTGGADRIPGNHYR